MNRGGPRWNPANRRETRGWRCYLGCIRGKSPASYISSQPLLLSFFFPSVLTTHLVSNSAPILIFFDLSFFSFHKISAPSLNSRFPPFSSSSPEHFLQNFCQVHGFSLQKTPPPNLLTLFLKF